MKKNIYLRIATGHRWRSLYNNFLYSSILKYPFRKTDIDISFAAEHWTQINMVFWKAYLLYSLQLQIRTLRLIEMPDIPPCHLVNCLVKNNNDICLYKQT